MLAAVFMVYLDRVTVPFPTGCRKQKGTPRIMKLPVLQMFPVSNSDNMVCPPVREITHSLNE